MEINNAGGAPANVLNEVEHEFARLTLLEHVLQWANEQSPPRSVETIVTQDEYTHDVVLSFRGPWYVVFDVT